MYDTLYNGSPPSNPESIKAVRDALAIDFALHCHPFYTEDARARQLLSPPQPEKVYEWAEDMICKGVASEDIEFLLNVLNPDPRGRTTGAEILESRYLQI
jgi:hypothetical protein